MLDMMNTRIFSVDEKRRDMAGFIQVMENLESHGFFYLV